MHRPQKDPNYWVYKLDNILDKEGEEAHYWYNNNESNLTMYYSYSSPSNASFKDLTALC